ncbi:MAG: helix-turn-helix transcriptional regulator [Prevotella sp.]|nr:helix-turn-helix transcriptional regulator [Prevotella sp.]
MTMKVYTLEEMEDKHIGKLGTPERDRYEQELSEELHAYHLGEAIREARLSRNMTQEQLGEKVGVQKSQISRLEKGRNVSLSSMVRLFKAMNIPLSLEIGGIGKVALW